MADSHDSLAQELHRMAGALTALADRVRALEPAPVLDPEWFRIAQADVGHVKEISGPAAHPRILEAQALTRYREPQGDETPWCSAIMCLWMHQAGYTHTASAAARSWLTYGQELEDLRRGAVVVLWRGDPDSKSGHVGLALSWDADNVTMIGGNQGNAVSSKVYPRSRILSIRWPEAV